MDNDDDKLQPQPAVPGTSRSLSAPAYTSLALVAFVTILDILALHHIANQMRVVFEQAFGDAFALPFPTRIALGPTVKLFPLVLLCAAVVKEVLLRNKSVTTIVNMALMVFLQIYVILFTYTMILPVVTITRGLVEIT